MPIAIQRPTPQTDPLDRVLKGLSIASSIYGIKADISRIEQAKAEQAIRDEKAQQDRTTFQQGQETIERQKAGQILPQDAASLAKDHTISNSATTNGQKLTVMDSTGPRDIWVSPKSKDPLELSKIQAEIERIKAETEKAKAEAGKVGAEKVKTVPASDAIALGSTNAAYKALDDASSAFDSNQDLSGPAQGRFSSLLAKGEIGETGKRAKAFDAQMKLNAQVIGKSLEGGKLTDQDIERYRSMLPNLSDSPEAAQNKIAILQNMLAQKQQAEQSALQQAGYNVGNIQGSPTKQNPNIRPNTTSQKPIDAARKELAGKSKEEQLDAIRAEMIRKAGIGATLPRKSGGS